MSNLAAAAKATIEHLDKLPRNPTRSQHKFNMIRIAERSHCNPAWFPEQPAAQREAEDQITSAVGYLRANGIY